MIPSTYADKESKETRLNAINFSFVWDEKKRFMTPEITVKCLFSETFSFSLKKSDIHYKTI